VLYSSNGGTFVHLFYGALTGLPGQAYSTPGFVMNANDQVLIATSGGDVDFLLSGLIQRGPGQVPS
jgi:hypothetical protein